MAAGQTNAPTQSDISVLERRIAALEQELADSRSERTAARAAFFSLSIDMLCIASDQGFFLDLNSSWTRTLGYTLDELRAEPFLHFVHPDDHQTTLDAVTQLARGEEVVRFSNRYRRKDGSYARIEWSSSANKDGTTYAIARDVSSRDETEAMLRTTLAQLQRVTTPLIPISDDILVMPLIGALDPARADGMLDALLRGVSERRARVAILDVTGVDAIDGVGATALTRAAQAVRLLGAEAMLTGLRPEFARALIALGVDLGGLVTCGTLQDGIRVAMARRG